MVDIQKNIIQPMFIKGVSDYSGYDEDGVTLIPEFYIQYANVNQIVHIEDLGTENVKTFEFDNETLACRYEVRTTNTTLYITQKQFDTLMNEYAIKLF